jgi:exonuclease III
MKVLSWNCQGAGSPETVRALKKLIKSYNPDIVFIMETKKLSSKTSNLCNIGNLNSHFFVDCITAGGGKAGGLGLLWNNETVNIEIKGHDFNYIDFYVYDNHVQNPNPWRATGIYGYPQHHNKFLTCSLISNHYY